MAATTISHNKPTAGSITWTAFNIAYNGANFTVPAGNTAAKFVWWVYNGGAPKLVTGDILPTLTADDTVLFLNKQGVGQLLPETTVVDGSLIVEESIYAQAIASDQIVSRHIVSDAITTEHLSANSVTAEQLSVGTVSANLVANGSFEDYDTDGNVVGWEVLQMTGGTIAPVTGVSSSGAIAVQMDMTAITGILRLSQKPDMFIPVSNASGRRWYVSARMGVGTAITKGAFIRAVWYDGNKRRLTSGDYTDVRSNGSLTTTFSVYEGQVAPPAAARFMAIEIILTAPNVATKMYVDEVTVNEVVVSAIIADGAITANKVAAKAITADKLTISDSTNILTDPGFEAGGSGWTLGAGTVVTIPAAEVRPTGLGTKVLQITGNGTVKDVQSDTLNVEAGEWYYASCYVRATTTTTSTGTVMLGATFNRSVDGPTWPTFDGRAANTITGTWQKFEGRVQVPANATTLSLRPSVRENVANGVFQFDDFTLRRMNGGELIVDGAIKTNHMTANTISGDVIAANTLVGSKLMADSITSRELVASEIWADSAWISAIAGRRIVGASIETNMAPDEGVKLADEGLVAHGTTTVAESVTPGQPFQNVLYKNTLTIAERPPGWSIIAGMETDGGTVPTIEFKGERADGKGATPPPLSKATISASNSRGAGLTLRSSRQDRDAPHSRMDVGPGAGEINAYTRTAADGTMGIARVEVGTNEQNGATWAELDAVGRGKGAPRTRVRALGSDGTVQFDAPGGLVLNNKPITQVAEYSVSGTKAEFDAGNQDVAILTYASSGSNSPTVASPGPGSLTITETGIYSFDFLLVLPVPATGRSFIQIANANGSALSRVSIVPGEDQTSASITGKILPAGTKIRFMMLQTTGGTRTYTATVRVMKHP